MSNVEVTHWFPTLISHQAALEIANLNDNLAKKARMLKNEIKNNNSIAWNCNTFSTMGIYDAFSDKDPDIKKIMDFSVGEVREFAKEFGVTGHDIECVDFWFNISGPNSYQEFHQHPGCHFSAVYYIDVPENSGEIVFRSHESVGDMFPLPILDNELTPPAYKQCYYKVKTSSFVIFRSNILHMVKTNNSDKERISIAMNFNVVRKS